jgi:hypothetical protein
MSHGKISSDPIRAHQRKSVASRRVGAGATCACGESRPEALITGSSPITCAECRRKTEGKSTTDLHHPAGKSNNSVTIPISVNDHRAILSTDQYDWPKRTLENPESSPLIAAAACVRGFISTISYLVVHLLEWIAGALEQIDRMLTERLGPRWWTNIDFNRNTQKGEAK